MVEVRAGRCVGGPYDGQDYACDQSFFMLAERPDPPRVLGAGEVPVMTMPRTHRYEWDADRRIWRHRS